MNIWLFVKTHYSGAHLLRRKAFLGVRAPSAHVRHLQGGLFKFSTLYVKFRHRENAKIDSSHSCNVFLLQEEIVWQSTGTYTGDWTGELRTLIHHEIIED